MIKIKKVLFKTKEGKVTVQKKIFFTCEQFRVDVEVENRNERKKLLKEKLKNKGIVLKWEGVCNNVPVTVKINKVTGRLVVKINSAGRMRHVYFGLNDSSAFCSTTLETEKGKWKEIIVFVTEDLGG